jgi:hypothetical protein
MTRAVCLLSLLGIALVCTTAGAEPIQLRFKPKVGQESKHRLMIAARIEESGGGDEEDRPSTQRSEATVHIDYAQKATAETDEQTTLETRQLNGQVEVSGEAGNVTINLPAFSTIQRLDRRRQTVGMEDMEGGDPPESDEDGTGCDIVGSLGVGCGEWAGIPGMLTLPAEPVDVGSTWKRDQNAGVSGASFVINYKLEALTTHSGRKCARIHATWRQQFSTKGLSDLSEMSAGSVGMFAAEGVNTGDLVWYYDYENGVDVSIEGALGNESTTVAFHSTGKAAMNLKIVLVE